MRLLKFLPVVFFFTLVLLTAGWLLLDWSFIQLLPFFVCLTVLFLSSVVFSTATSILLKRLFGTLLIMTSGLGTLLVTNLVDMRSVWEILAMIGMLSVQLYFYILSQASNLLKGRASFILLVPIITSLGSIFSTILFGSSLTLAWWSLFLGLILAIIALLFGFKKKEIV